MVGFMNPQDGKALSGMQNMGQALGQHQGAKDRGSLGPNPELVIHSSDFKGGECIFVVHPRGHEERIVSVTAH